MFPFDWFSSIYNFLYSVWQALMTAPNPFWAGVIFLANGGWIFVVIILWDAFKAIWLEWRREVYHLKTRRFILLAIDVPRDNEQSPKAVENIFTHLHGALPGTNTKWQTWGLGKTVDYFSLEIVSIDGYVQFLAYTMEDYRDMVESAFYAQYPDAEITQVEDYVHGVDDELKHLTFPSDEYDLFGSEIVLGRGNSYPIRLYSEFEHTLSQEFKDPMASFLENMNKIGPGEQIWLQLVITPEYHRNWVPQANAEAMKIAGKAVAEKATGLLDQVLGGLLKWIDAACIAVFPFYSTGAEEAKQEEMPSLMLHLTPTERSQVEGIQLKADKPGFWCKFRFIYLGKKKIFSRARGVAPILGSVRQLSSLNLNSLDLHRYTKTSGLYYLFVKQRMARRQNLILRAFQGRSRSLGSNGIILNSEELATIYHFPNITVKAPLVARTQAKRASAPASLPLETPSAFSRFKERGQARREAGPAELPVAEVKTNPAPTEAVPENLPFV